MTTGRRTAALFLAVFAGMMLLQTPWVFAVDPFRAIDEFDHSQRADAVAEGQWLVGEGDLVSVDRDLNDAVVAVCLSRPRLDPGACRGAATADGRALVSSTAAAYNPLFYWVVGTASQPFTNNGYHQLYAQRAATTLVNGLVTSLGLVIALTAFRTRWPFVLALSSLTPMVTYTSVVVAPNGLEIASALTLWFALLGLRLGVESFRDARWPWVVVGASACMIGFVRTLGPLWLICIVMSVGVAGGSDRSWLVNRRGLAAIAAGSVGIIGGAAWALVAGTNRIEKASASSIAQLSSSGSAWTEGGGDYLELPIQAVVWLFQTVGAIPYRDETLPSLVYGTVFLLWLALVAVGMRRAARPVFWAVVAIGSASVAIPLAFSIATLQAGWLWQGRYGWPLAMGMLFLAGVAAERGQAFRSAPKVPAVTGALAALTMAAANVLAITDVISRETRLSPLAGTDAVIAVPAWVLTGSIVCGFAALWGVTVLHRPPPVAGAAPGESCDMLAARTP